MNKQWIKEYTSIKGHTDFISCIEFFGTDKRILTASSDGTLILSDLASKKKIHKYNLTIPVKAAAFNEVDGKLLALTDDKLIHIWKSSTHKKISEFPVVGPRAKYGTGKLGYKYMTVADFSPDRKNLALGCHDKNIYIVPTVPNRKTDRLVGHKTAIYDVGWINNDLIYSTDQYYGHITVWDRHKRKPVINIPYKTFSSIAVHDLKLAIGRFVSRRIDVRDASTGNLIKTLRSGFLFSEVVTSICFHPDGIHIATGMNRGSLRLWNIESGKSYIVKGAHTGTVNRIRFSENGRFLASSDNKNFIVKIWKVSI